MCCFFASLMMFGPRFAMIIWWLINPGRWEATFSNFFLPFLGFLFLPWTTLAYVAVAPGGVVFLDWVVLGMGLFIDVGSYTSSERGWQQRQATVV